MSAKSKDLSISMFHFGTHYLDSQNELSGISGKFKIKGYNIIQQHYTEKGKATERNVIDSEKQLNEIMLDSFSKEEQDRFQSYLLRLIEHLEK